MAATTCKTLTITPEVCPVNEVPTKVEVSGGNVFKVVLSLINSYFWFMLAPPGFTTAPSLNMLSPNLEICVCNIVCSCVNSLACTALPELNSIL